jgi:hypothetical protein
MRCVTQCRASLLSLAKPCCQCRTESSPGALTSFHRMFPNAFRKILEECLATEVRVRVPIVRVPMIAALCCPRVMPGSVEGAFVEVPGDNRMYYKGLNDAGFMTWTCMTCSRETSLRELPRGWNSHFCCQHGAMCYVLANLETVSLSFVHLDGRPFWSCCDNTKPVDDVPLIIEHVVYYEDASLLHWPPALADAETRMISDDEEMPPADHSLRRDGALQEGGTLHEEADVLTKILGNYDTDDKGDGDPSLEEGDTLRDEVAALQGIEGDYDTARETRRFHELLQRYEGA